MLLLLYTNVNTSVVSRGKKYKPVHRRSAVLKARAPLFIICLLAAEEGEMKTQ
jgi:hypothetical protein